MLLSGIAHQNVVCYNDGMGNQKAKAAYPPPGGADPPAFVLQKKGGMPMVTYADLFQFCLLLVTLVGLCYQIFKGKK